MWLTFIPNNFPLALLHHIAQLTKYIVIAKFYIIFDNIIINEQADGINHQTNY